MIECGLHEEVLIEYEPKMKSLLAEAEVEIGVDDIDAILSYLSHDKKNKDGHVSFVLLKTVERPIIDQEVSMDLVRESLMELIKVLNEL